MQLFCTHSITEFPIMARLHVKLNVKSKYFHSRNGQRIVSWWSALSQIWSVQCSCQHSTPSAFRKKSNTHITFLWEHGWCMKVDSGMGWSGRWLWHIILNPRWKCLRWCYLRMSDHQRSVMCNVSDYPLHNCGRWWWLMTCIITHPSPRCHPPAQPSLAPQGCIFCIIDLIWTTVSQVKLVWKRPLNSTRPLV